MALSGFERIQADQVSCFNQFLLLLPVKATEDSVFRCSNTVEPLYLELVHRLLALL